MDRLLCAGVGQLNNRVARLALNAEVDVIGFRRSPEDPALGFPQRSLNLAEDFWLDIEADSIVIALSAGERSIIAYQKAYIEPILQLGKSLLNWQKKPKRLVVVSSSRVYGQDEGEWLNDQTQPNTDDEYGKILIEMETLVDALPVETVVVRLSGIYAPGRDWLKRMALKAEQADTLLNSWTNRIHIDDAAAAIWHILNLDNVEPSYIVSDLEPVTKIDMYNYFRAPNNLAMLRQTEGQRILGKRLKPSRLVESGFEWTFPNAFSGGYDV